LSSNHFGFLTITAELQVLLLDHDNCFGLALTFIILGYINHPFSLFISVALISKDLFLHELI
jgi:hypothetical protein